ncbi:MAG: phosphocholine cytidylyltransferase family protein [Burkholderiaceae bacterium]
MALTQRAVVLAAGRGSRLLALTEDRPKCLVEVQGRPILDWTIDALRAAGMTDIALVGGYRREMLEGLADELLENPRWQCTNMVRSLACASARLRESPIVVSYSDILYHPDHVRALCATDAAIAITYDTCWRSLWDERFDDPGLDAESFAESGGWLHEIGGRAPDLDAVLGQFMGLLRITPAGWRQIEAVVDSMTAADVDRLDMTGLLSRLLADGCRVAAVPVAGRWCEIDSESDLALADTRANAGDWPHDWRRSAW